MTKGCYLKFIKEVDIDEDIAQTYTSGIIAYSDIDTNNPKVFLRTLYEDNEGTSELRYFNISFINQGTNNGYIIDKINIVKL